MLLDTVRKTINEYSMLEAGDKVLCAVSGGADSICLLRVMLALKEEYNISLYVANVNHLIRGEEAEHDSNFVKTICEAEGVECFYREYDVPAISRQQKIGEEECGRKLRYEFFDEISEKLGGVKIATAHNLGDNAETVLFRLIRGSSSNGLGGIKNRRGNIIRPLLDVSRDEIEKYLEENNFSWCEDSTNKLAIYSRNRLRLCVIPELEKISAGAEKKIVNAAKLLKEDNDFLSDCAELIKEKCVFDDYIIIEPVLASHIALKRRVAAMVLDLWSAKEITNEKIDSFLDFLLNENGKSFDINAQYYAEKAYDKVYLRKRGKEAELFYTLNETAEISRDNWTIDVKISSAPPKRNSNNIAVFDAEKLSFPLTVTYRKEGDKIAPKGMQGAKKLSDIFTDEKIERSLRDIIPVIRKDNDILFICGIRQSSLYSADAGTKKYLVIEYKIK